MNLELIFERIWHQRLPERGVRVRSKISLHTTSFLKLFLGALEGACVEVTTPKMTSQGGE